MLLFVASIVLLLGIIAISAGACVSLGNLKMKRLSILISLGGGVAGIVGLVLIYVSYLGMCNADNLEKVSPSFPYGFWVYAVLVVIALLGSIIAFFIVPKADKEMPYEMESKFKLFLMFLPFALLAFVFCYLPLFGWRYAFFDYQAGDTLSMDKFVGFKWFTYLFQNAATRRDIVRVLRNTLAMSGLGIITSWVPLAFAVLLTEIENKKFRRFVQTFTTVPNFISWIIVYTVALAIFSTDGFINTFAQSMGWISTGTNYMMGDNGTWLKMLAWGLWKGTGWSAIIYIAGISGIDRQLYEAATVDGANRFQRIWHVTLPGLIPTYMVMLLMSVAGMLSNGLDQYLVFSNPSNKATMEVLDLYVYNLGIAGGSIPLSTVIGMAKSIVSVILLFMANGISKLVRGESIV
jgi:putative aldouronate transport system permease protein